MEDHIPIPVYVNDFWAIFNLVRGMAYSILDRCLVWYEWISSIFVKSSVNCLGTHLNLILYINLLISSLKIQSILSIWVSLYNLHTSELNVLNVIILDNLLWIILKVLSVEKDDEPSWWWHIEDVNTLCYNTLFLRIWMEYSAWVCKLYLTL